MVNSIVSKTCISNSVPTCSLVTISYEFHIHCLGIDFASLSECLQLKSPYQYQFKIHFTDQCSALLLETLFHSKLLEREKFYPLGHNTM
jgi:hypothetical protein